MHYNNYNMLVFCYSDGKEYALKLIEGTGISMSACREIAVSIITASRKICEKSSVLLCRGAGTGGQEGGSNEPPEIYLGVKHAILTSRFFCNEIFFGTQMSGLSAKYYNFGYQPSDFKAKVHQIFDFGCGHWGSLHRTPITPSWI